MIVAPRRSGDIADWRWPSFTPAEMACSMTGTLVYNADFMDWLQALRYLYAKPMVITSGYRSPEHQKTLPGSRETGAHVDAMAVDVKVSGTEAHNLMVLAAQLGVKGVGVHQHGDWHSRYLHLDMWDTELGRMFRPALWDY